MESRESKSSKLQHLPIMLFAITMGFGGLTLAYKKAAEVLLIPPFFYQTLTFIIAILALIIFCLYCLKLIKYPKMVLQEFNHPIKINFFATISMSMLLLSNIFREMPHFSLSLFSVGMGLQTFVAFYVIAYWLNKDIQIAHSNPAWFIPVAGNLLVSASGIGFVNEYLLMFFFSLGMFFWIILTAILFNRIIFHGMLAQKFLPTLAIFIAPPPVAMLGYLNINGGEFDIFAKFLLNIALAFALLLFVLAKNFYKITFFISWWAFTFPFAALTMALLTAYEKTQYTPFKFLSLACLVLTSITIAFVGLKTIGAIMRGEICKEE
ncbi:SLAC1 anion channel family protein [Helicobacter sp. MIT 21-1697]|uniref:SLAC1 anion channel family protein n=1 Tax=Helicobacter sp. MIT 21-1697 TaxID=2993733 RepID=UPI00224AB84D|nr:SLAC1 anion channel family protein [Helicobacter sp. MIT 21-1697]MCX2717300.1 SLAC1 anion channel family protein [Helicobacter sp. MIT 21-1697]